MKLGLIVFVVWLACVGVLVAIGIEGLKLGFFAGALAASALTVFGVKAFLTDRDDEDE